MKKLLPSLLGIAMCAVATHAQVGNSISSISQTIYTKMSLNPTFSEINSEEMSLSEIKNSKLN